MVYEQDEVDPVTGSVTGLIHDFGTDVDEVWMTTWYESAVDDCDYNYATCGITSGSYPTATVTVQAMLVTDPAEVSIESFMILIETQMDCRTVYRLIWEQLRIHFLRYLRLRWKRSQTIR